MRGRVVTPVAAPPPPQADRVGGEIADGSRVTAPDNANAPRPHEGGRRTPGQARGAEQAEGSRGDQASAAASSSGQQELSADEKKEVGRLKARDAEVRAHEQAHASAGGSHAGSPSYEFKTGPDGRRYAVGGEVSIDTSEIPGDAKASIQKLEQVARAANAPAEPSGQDRKVAAKARAKIARLRAKETAKNEEAKAPAKAGETAAAQGSAETDETQSDTQGTKVASPVAARAMKGYASQATYATPAPAPSLDITACANCGSGHS